MIHPEALRRLEEATQKGARLENYVLWFDDLRTLLAAYRQQAALIEELEGKANRQDETGWLIEHPTEPVWWSGFPISTAPEFWTSDSSKAVRFPRREDAETLAHFDFDGECRVTEHIWADTPRERLERRLAQHVKDAAERVGARVAEAVAEIKERAGPSTAQSELSALKSDIATYVSINADLNASLTTAEAEVERLREALEPFVVAASGYSSGVPDDYEIKTTTALRIYRRAAEALRSREGGA